MDSITSIVVGSDHAGFELKERIKNHLTELGYTVVDKGDKVPRELDDYPDFIVPVAREVAAGQGKVAGIIFGGSGQGEAMAANRIKGARAAVYYGHEKNDVGLSIIKLSREHNNANILSFGARFVNFDEAKTALSLWLNTPFSNEGRHIRRINKLDE